MGILEEIVAIPGFDMFVITVASAVLTGWLLTRVNKFGRDKKLNPYGVRVAKDSWLNALSPQAPLSRPKRDVLTLFQNLEYTATHNGERRALGWRPTIKMHKEKKEFPDPADKSKKIEKVWTYPELGGYQWTTYKEFFDAATHFGRGLRKLGMEPHSNFAICDETNQQWTTSAHGCYSQSIVVLTVYTNLGEKKIVAALGEGEVTGVQVNGIMLKSLSSFVKDLPSLKFIVVSDHPDSQPELAPSIAKLKESGIDVHFWDSVVELGKEAPDIPLTPPRPDDIAVIMYTSGSTGLPKGVLLSHENMIACVASFEMLAPLTQDDVYLSYLPLAHVLALVIESCSIFKAIEMGYGSPRSLMNDAVRNCKGDFSELRPTFLPVVPAIANRIKKATYGALGKSGFLRFLFDTAYSSREAALKQGDSFPFWTSFVFNKVKAGLGGRVKFMVSGGAPLQPDAHQFLRIGFDAVVVQGYGLTETCGGATVMMADDLSTGRCGPPLPSAVIKLVDCKELGYSLSDKPNPRGEIIIAGPNVSRGYYKNEQKTKEDFRDGGFATGDIGEISEDGTLKIIDRKKSLVKAAHGEYLALDNLESVFVQSKYVTQGCFHVDSAHNSLIGFVQPDRKAIEMFAKEKNIDEQFEDLCKNKEIKNEILKDFSILALKEKLKGFEHVKNVRLTDFEWTSENQWVTPNGLKTNGRFIRDSQAEQIKEMYHELGES